MISGLMKYLTILSLSLMGCTLTRAPKSHLEVHCVTKEDDRQDSESQEDEQTTEVKKKGDN